MNAILGVREWFTQPEQWSGPDGIPTRVLEHLWYSLLGFAITVLIALPAGLARYLVEKGSITVDGVSLTVVEAGDAEFSVALIPATKELTTLGFREPGDEVNIEVDVLAKHLERLAQPLLGGPDRGSGGVSEDNGGVGEAR